MKEPTIYELSALIVVCLVMALIGLYLLANYNRLFRGSIKNAFLRRNVVAWLVIFCINGSMTALSGGAIFYIIVKFGWFGVIGGHFLSTTAATVLGFNIVWLVSENRRLKKLSFVKHKLLLLLAVIVMTLLINVPIAYFVWDYGPQYIHYSIITSIYVGGAIGLVYSVINYLNIERKRKFDEKELELSRLRESKAKAELDALHSKVNPHFLYNALNSIADLSITDGKKARRMTIALADLFRYSINYSHNNYSTVNDEVAMTEVYLQIEKIRFEDQLNYSVKVDEEAGHYLIPRFILQPLVENAVKHGLKATGMLTEIFLEIKNDNGVLIVNIADNGPLFPDELIPGYGVKSVFDKLDLLFPDQYEIHFTNQPRKQISIQINKLMKNEPGI